MDETKEGTMGKQKNVWTVCRINAKNKKRNMELARKTDLKVETKAMLNVVLEQIKQPNHHFTECVTTKVKQYPILCENVICWHKRSRRE